VITEKASMGEFDAALAYAKVKYIAALWMVFQASVSPDLRLITMSPGTFEGLRSPTVSLRR